MILRGFTNHGLTTEEQQKGYLRKKFFGRFSVQMVTVDEFGYLHQDIEVPGAKIWFYIDGCDVTDYQHSQAHIDGIIYDGEQWALVDDWHTSDYRGKGIQPVKGILRVETDRSIPRPYQLTMRDKTVLDQLVKGLFTDIEK